MNAAGETAAGAVKLSIVIAAPNNTVLLQRCLASLTGQVETGDTEVIVVSNYDDGAGAMMAARFPYVRHIRLPVATIVPELRAEGIRQSQGEIVALAEDHGYFEPGWCAAVKKAHAQPYAIIGGVVENDRAQRALDWAVYFYDYSKYMLPQQAGPVETLSGNNVSYKRSLLQAAEAHYRDGFYEVFLHEQFKQQGQELYLIPDAVVVHNKHYALGSALAQCFHGGRSYSGMRVAGASIGKRGVYALGSLVLPVLLPARVALQTFRKERHISAFIRCLPYLMVLMCGWAAGELCGYMAGEGNSSRHWK